VYETLERTLLERVEGNDACTAVDRVLELVEHARAVGAHVLTEGEDRVGLAEVLEPDCAYRYADAFRQRDRRGLVAHVRAVRQIVGAVEPRQKLVHVGRLERGSSRRVEDDAPGIACTYGREFPP